MDHCYGVLQDSGMVSPSQPGMKNAGLKGSSPYEHDESGFCAGKEDENCVVIIPEDICQTEEVETTDDESLRLASSNSALQFSILAGKKDSRASSTEDSHHDSGISSMCSFVSEASGISIGHHSLTSSKCLSSPMEVFVPNATSTPEDGITIKMEVDSPCNVSQGNGSSLHRSALLVNEPDASPSRVVFSPEDLEQVARPGTPVHNKSSDMSHMDVPSDGYFSRENLRSIQNKVPHAANPGRLLNRRKQMSLKVESTPPRQSEGAYCCLPHSERTPSPVRIPKLNLCDDKEYITCSEVRTPVNILKTEPQPVGTEGEKMVIQIPALKPRTHTLTYSLRPSLERSGPHQGPGSFLPQVKASIRHKGPSSTFSSLAQMSAAAHSSADASDLSGDKFKAHCTEPRDDSLTSIHWLHNLSGAGFVPNTSPLIPVTSDYAPGSSPGNLQGQAHASPLVLNGNHIILPAPETHCSSDMASVVDNKKHIRKIAEECGRNERPPYAYMHLIQMAIKSYPEQKATLRQIYTWIEETFPYYKHTNKKGWKNSIRHNLSLYNIFVRKRGSGSPGNTGCSYWTLESGVKPMPKSRLANTVIPMPKKSVQQPVISSNYGKKGPAPLLPKPPAVQSYTIIPLASDQSLSPSVIGSHAIVVTPDHTSMASAGGCLDTETIQAINSIISFPSSEETAFAKVNTLKRSQQESEWDGPQKKLVKVAAKPSILNRGRRLSLANRSSSFDTSDLLHQMSNMKFDSTLTDGQDSQDGAEFASQSRTVRAKKPRKEKIRYRVDSTDKREEAAKDLEDEDTMTLMNADQMNSGFSLDDDMNFPLRGLLETPPRDIKTSTPSRPSPGTPASWISPIHGFSSADDHILIDMASLLDENPSNKGTTSEDHQHTNPGSAGSSPGLGSLRSLGLPGLTPLKAGQLLGGPEDDLCLVAEEHLSPNNSFNLCNQSFTRLLGDFHLDSVIGDDISNSDYSLSFGPLH